VAGSNASEEEACISSEEEAGTFGEEVGRFGVGADTFEVGAGMWSSLFHTFGLIRTFDLIFLI